MSKTIWKFYLQVTDTQTISMPRDATILDVQVQEGEMHDIPIKQITVWAIVNPDNPTESVTFHLCATGHPINFVRAAQRYIGTVQIYGFVWHVFLGDENEG